VFSTVIHFHPSLIFAGKAWSLPLEWGIIRVHSDRPDLAANIRPEWMKMIVENTLAYRDTASITTVKSCIGQTRKSPYF
jgi:hypothetical protein